MVYKIAEKPKSTVTYKEGMHLIANSLSKEEETNLTQLKLSISHGIGAISALLVQVKSDPKDRPFIDALLSASNGESDWVQITHEQIGRRIRNFKASNMKEKSLATASQRAFKRLWKWQEQSAVNLFDVQTGGVEFVMQDGCKKKVMHANKYRLNILKVAALLLEEAYNSGLLTMHGTNALHFLAPKYAPKLCDIPLKVTKFKHASQEPEKIVDRKIRAFLTFFGNLEYGMQKPYKEYIKSSIDWIVEGKNKIICANGQIEIDDPEFLKPQWFDPNADYYGSSEIHEEKLGSGDEN